MLKRERVALVSIFALAVVYSAGFLSAEESDKRVKQSMSMSDHNSDSPIFIKSDSLELDSKQKLFTYKGDVEISQDKTLITADRVVGKYNDKSEIEEILCKKNVVITKGTDLRATSDRAVYDVASSTVVLTDGPEVFDKGNVLTADKVTVYLDEERSEAEGNVRVRVIREGEQGVGIDSLKELGDG